MEKIISEYINKLNGEIKSGWLETAAECKDFGDDTGCSYCKGVIAGLDVCIELLNKLMDKELERMANNMEGEKR